MRVSRRDRRAPLLTYVVDPFSAEAREWIGAVRELGLQAGEAPLEVVCTGDRGSEGDDSVRAAAGIIALLAADPRHPVLVVEDVLRAAVDEGADISDPGVIGGIACARGLDADAVTLVAASAAALAMARDDRELARGLGDPEGAAVLHVVGDRVRRLPGPGSTGRQLVSAWRTLPH